VHTILTLVFLPPIGAWHGSSLVRATDPRDRACQSQRAD